MFQKRVQSKAGLRLRVHAQQADIGSRLESTASVVGLFMPLLADPGAAAVRSAILLMCRNILAQIQGTTAGGPEVPRYTGAPRPTVDVPGREWRQDIEYTLLQPTPINKVRHMHPCLLHESI